MGSSKTTYQTSFTDPGYMGAGREILNLQGEASARPYVPYEGDRIAGFTQAQQRGFNLAGNAATGYRPMLMDAVGGTQDVMDRSALGAASPYFQRAAQNGNLDEAYGALDRGLNMTRNSTRPTGLNMAQPYLQQAGQSSVGNIDSYMNPYLENVVNRYGELGARTLNEQLMPAIESKYISAGQLGFGPRGGSGTPSGMMTDTARAVRDVQEGVGKQQQQALAEGYGQAAGLAQGDLARYAQLGQTAGQLGQNQQQLLLNAGGQMGALGSQYANIGLDQQQLMAQLGAQTGNLYNADTSNQLNANQQLGQFANQYQNQQITGANALLGVGNQQQGLNQAQMDVNYQNYLAQQGYTQQQIDNYVKTYQGVYQGMPQNTIQQQTSKSPSTGTGGQFFNTINAINASGR